MNRIYFMLNRLGITATYVGFHYCSLSIYLALENMERLLQVTKCIYPEVADRYQTTATAVEKDMRYIIIKAWERNPVLLESWAGGCLQRRPTPSQFISILATQLMHEAS